MLSRFGKYLKSDHFSTINQILRYLGGSLEINFIFEEESELNLIKYLDSDLAKDHFDTKSISGFIFTPNDGSISYSSKK